MAGEIKFWDVSKRLDWFRARALMAKILERPGILAEMRACIETCWGDDPSKARSLHLWRRILDLSPEKVARALLADTPEAEETRESYPPYVALTAQERAEYIEAAHKEVAMA